MEYACVNFNVLSSRANCHYVVCNIVNNRNVREKQTGKIIIFKIYNSPSLLSLQVKFKMYNVHSKIV